MPRIFLAEDVSHKSSVRVTGEKASYLSTVLRCREGDPLSVTDSTGQTYSAAVLSAAKKEVVLGISCRLEIAAESPLRIVLLQGLLRGEKMDLVIQKTTELGVQEIRPVATQRSQLQETRKLARWRKIAEEASRQSGRNIVPAIHAPAAFNGLFECALNADIKIIFWEEGGSPLASVLGKLENPGSVMLFVGPEGGFSGAEVDLAVQHGFAVTTLGKRILRAETAAISAVSLVQFILGDLGA